MRVALNLKRCSADFYVLINESSGRVCHLCSRTGKTVGSRSTCYRVKKVMSEKCPHVQYAVYKLVRLGRCKSA